MQALLHVHVPPGPYILIYKFGDSVFVHDYYCIHSFPVLRVTLLTLIYDPILP